METYIVGIGMIHETRFRSVRKIWILALQIRMNTVIKRSICSTWSECQLIVIAIAKQSM
jgi:hypothetical protein